jgi:hypothetical protein
MLPPTLPDLHIQDSENNNHIPVGGVEGWDNDYLQAQTICFAPLVFQSEIAKAGGDETDFYWCRRLSTVLVSLRFTDAGAIASIRIKYEDKNGVIAVGESMPVSATAAQDNSRYLGAIQSISTNGANRVAVIIESVSSGLVDIDIAGI